MKTLKVWLASALMAAVSFFAPAHAYVVTTAELAPLDTDITSNLAVLVPWAIGVFIAIFGAKLVFRLIRGFVSQSA